MDIKMGKVTSSFICFAVLTLKPQDGRTIHFIIISVGTYDTWL